MAQNIERAEALKKMRNFAAQTTDRGRTEDEMNLAMRQLQKLSTAFNISLDELNLRDEPCVTRTVDTGSKMDQAVNTCGRAIAEFTGCVFYSKKGAKTIARDAQGEPIVQTYVRRKNGIRTTGRRYKMMRAGNTHYVFFGLETDADMAVFLFTMLKNAIELETKSFKRSAAYKEAYGPKKSASHTFQYAMASRINSRLNEMADAQDRDVKAAQVGATDVMVVKMKHVEAEFKTTGVKLVNGGRRTNRLTSSAGWSAGHAAGGRVNLSRPVGNSSSTLLLS